MKLQYLILLSLFTTSVLSEEYKWGFGWDNGITLRRDMNNKLTIGCYILPISELYIRQGTKSGSKNYAKSADLDLTIGLAAIINKNIKESDKFHFGPYFSLAYNLYMPSERTDILIDLDLIIALRVSYDLNKRFSLEAKFGMIVNYRLRKKSYSTYINGDDVIEVRYTDIDILFYGANSSWIGLIFHF